MSQTAIIYARFSSTEQAKGDSLERQHRYGKAFVEANDWTLEAVLDDQGLSAYRGTNRQEGSALHAFESESREGQHHGKVLVVENIDRLSRQGAKAAARLIWALNDFGVDVATWHDKHIYRAGEAGELMDIFSIVIKAQMSHEESANKSRRQIANIASRYERIANGDKTTLLSAHPAWVTYTASGYIAEDHRASVINEVFNWYLAGDGLLAIAQRLNERGEPTWSRKEQTSGWHVAYVSRLLKSRQVLGEVADRNGVTISPDHFPQVMDAKRFEEVQRLISSKKGTGGRDARKTNNLLAGVMVCAQCDRLAGYIGKGVSTVKYVTAGGETRNYQRDKYARVCCDSHRRKSGCTNGTKIAYKVIEDFILTHLFEIAANELDLSKSNNMLTGLRAAQAEKRREIDALQSKLDHLVDVIADGGSKALVAKTVEFEAAIDAHIASLAALTSQVEAEEAKPRASDDAALVDALRNDLDSDDADTRLYARIKTKAALGRIVPRIYIEPNDTFTVWSEEVVWTCDKKGMILSGQAI